MNTINETEKLLAAMNMSDSGILTGKQKYSDIQRVKAILPNHYEVTESKDLNAIYCKSKIGIRKTPYTVRVRQQPVDGVLKFTYKNVLVTDAEDEEHWEYIFKAIKQYFGNRFSEVYHNVCFCHTDFIIYLRRYKNLQ